MLMKLLIIFVGGGLGSCLRYLVSLGVQRFAGDGFPLGTLAVNTIGCFAIGVAAHAMRGDVEVRSDAHWFLVIGLLGGFTTFSTFANETLHLGRDGAIAHALLNVLLSNALGLLAAWCGLMLAGRVFSQPA
ncbi:MAG: fluoride efflux transporter CrcB [Planctomycetota bacterium]